ncbi:MAG: winged helix-turn-helix domain-containing protein [Polyangiaceae bacterium]
MARPAPYRVGPFVLDVAEWRLTKDGVEIQTQPAVLRLLQYLCDRPNTLVTRHQILEEVWDATVSDAALSQMMRRLRVALGDDTDSPKYLVTLPKRGYRFIHAVERVAPAPVRRVDRTPIEFAAAMRPTITSSPSAVPSSAIPSSPSAIPSSPSAVPVPSSGPSSLTPISSRRAATGLVGRAQDLEAIDRAFAAGARLVTLHGPGGQGKTRLATAWIERVSAIERRPAIFVDLVSVRGADGLLQSIASRLPSWSLPRADAVDIAPVLGRQLSREGGLVLVLDNFEQLVEEAPLVEILLDVARELRILVTSRVKLATARERVVALGGLAKEDAVALFRSLPTTGTAEPEAALVALAQRLDGNPLAIELAAARMPLLSAAEISARLDRRFELLRKRTRGRAHRHDSLEATISGSWELLDGDARAALVACAVFPDAFGYSELERVAGPAARRPFDAIRTLEEHALVHGDGGGDRRCVVLESVREWVSQQPELAAERRGASDRFVDHVLACTTPLVARLEDGADRAADAALLRELLRLRTAVGLALSSGRRDDAAALVAGIYGLLEERGPVAELTRMLNELLDGPGALRPELEVKLRLGRALLAERASKKEQVERDLARALELAPPGSIDAGRVASALAFVLAERSHAKEALPHAEEAARVALHHGHATDIAKSHRTLEIVLRALGRRDDAEAAAARALAACTSPLQDRARLGLLVNAAVAAQRAYAFDAAERGYREALGLAISLGMRRGEGLLLVNLAGLLIDRGKFAEAEELVARADGVLFEVGDQRLLAILASHRANFALYRGRDDEAVARFKEHRDRARKTGHASSEAYALAHLAILAWRARDLGAAFERLVEAERVLAQVEAPNERNLAMVVRVGLSMARGDRGGALAALDPSAPRVLVAIANIALGETTEREARDRLGAAMDEPIHRVLLALVG